MDDPPETPASVIPLLERLSGLTLPLSPAAHDALRADVCAYVEELKARGWPPERVIVAVKKILRSAGLRPSRRVFYSEFETSTPEDKLTVEIVGWCIDCYFNRSRNAE